MSRWLAVLLGIVGGGAVALGVVVGLVAALGGFLWIFVFGDDPWPPSVMRSLDIAIPLIGLALWALFGWVIWKRLIHPRGAG